MPEVYEVANVEEAVNLAYKLKEKNEYDLFRGQVIDYLPYSSLFRLREDVDREKAEFRYNLFINWIKETPALQYLLEKENVHQLEAIMQHYGIPTDYIDFTTDPGIAGFFAADTNNPPVNRSSCIYCLKTTELLSVWNIMKDFDSRKGCRLEIVTTEVKNLWRLQAQKGVFLVGNYNFEVDYPLDKIVFPYSGYPSYPTKDIIYPTHKSSLELLLDQYFDRERTTLLHRELKDHVNFISWDNFPDGFYVQGFKEPSKIKILDSWNEHLTNWNIYKNEDYHTTTGTTQKLRLNNLQQAEEIKQVISYGVKQLLRSNPSIREKTIDWVFDALPDMLKQDRASALLSKVWNGMRSLPFDNDDISEACGNTIYLHLKSIDRELTQKDELEIFSSLFGETMRVGFANEDRTGSYGYASTQSILDAREINMEELVTDEYTALVKSTYDSFKLMYNPKLMFDFTRFKTFFAKQVLPSQIAWDQSLIVFNPSKLITFGIP